MAHQLRQLGDIDRDPSRLIAGQWLRRCAWIVEMYIGELLPVVVLHDEIRFAFFNGSGRGEAAVGHGSFC